MKTTTLLLIGIASILFPGCDSILTQPRHAGIVFGHVGSADSGTGTSNVLAETGHFGVGFDYGEPDAIDWNATIDWTLLASNDRKDTYRLKWVFTPASGSVVSGASDVSYDGTIQSVVVVNDQFSITIDPVDAMKSNPR